MVKPEKFSQLHLVYHFTVPLKKKWLVVSNMTSRIWWIFTKTLKSSKVLLKWAILSKVYEIWVKKNRRVIFYDTEKRCKIWINPDLVVSKVEWGIGWTSIRALKSLKNCTLMSSFCPKQIMFQLKNFIGIMCHDTESWCKIYRKTNIGLEK